MCMLLPQLYLVPVTGLGRGGSAIASELICRNCNVSESGEGGGVGLDKLVLEVLSFLQGIIGEVNDA